MSRGHLSLPTAIIINMNIMMGAGLFINTIPLAQLAGIFSPAIYLLVGLVMFPLVLSMAKLLKLHPSGSFYTFGAKEMSPLFGFLGSWSYFVGKLASATLMMHFSMLIVHAMLPCLQQYNILMLDLCVIALFAFLNLLNMRTGSKIQFTFMALKTVPILLVIVSGLLFFDLLTINTMVNWENIPFSIPLVIYAFAGFEASCSLSAHIHNPERNAPLATIISYFLVIMISALYQLMFYGVVSAQLGTMTNYAQIFPALLNNILPAALAAYKIKIQALLQFAIAFSSLGGAYGILYSNGWNLRALAINKHFPFSSFIAQLNKHGIPTICIITEAFICATYILVTRGNNIPLQQLGAFGCTLAYTFCSLALFAGMWRSPNRLQSLVLPALALVSCGLLLASCINGFIKQGGYGPLAFFIIAGFGLSMFYLQKLRSSRRQAPQDDY